MSERPPHQVQFVELDLIGRPGADWKVAYASAIPRAGESVWLPNDADGATERLFTIHRVEWSGEWPAGTPDDPGVPTLSPIHYVRPIPGEPTRRPLR